MNNLILIGFKSAGKTTLGRKVAATLKRPFIDTDDLLGAPPSLLYHELGPEEFRRLEKACLAQLKGRKGHVIATGGGLPLDSDNQAFLKNLGSVVFLNTPKEIIERRSTVRFLDEYDKRLGIYAALAHHSIIHEKQIWEVIRLDPFSA